MPLWHEALPVYRVSFCSGLCQEEGEEVATTYQPYIEPESEEEGFSSRLLELRKGRIQSDGGHSHSQHKAINRLDEVR